MLFLGYADGAIRAHCLGTDNVNIDWRLDDHWTLAVHGGAAVEAIFPMEALNGHLLAACGADGGLAVFRLGPELQGFIDRAAKYMFPQSD